MSENNMKELLARLVQTVDLRPKRDYWMVRTSNGIYYNPFIQHGIVALKLPYITNEYVARLRNHNDDNVALQSIQEHLRTLANNPQNAAAAELGSPNVASTRASQIFNFCFKMKAGDMVLIPSDGATNISIGIITDDFPIINQPINDSFPIARSVRWVNQIPKIRLEPGLYRALGAHQALANISKYAEYLERNYGSCFMINDVCHYVLTINSEHVSANQFFGLGSTLITTLQKLSEQYDLGVNTQDIHLSMNLNSPGKIDFIATPIIAFLIMALLTSCSDGGINFNDVAQIPQDLFHSLVDLVLQPVRQEGEIHELSDSLLNYLNGTDAQAVEQYNQNTLNALQQIEE